MIVIGKRLFGGTDTVPGLFFVQTMFFHFDFIPLIPLGSYLMIDIQSNGRRNRMSIPIPLNGKSIAVAWIRFLSGLVMVGSLIWFIINVSDASDASDDNDDDKNPIAIISDCLSSFVVLVLSIAMASYLMWGKVTRNATYERATEICSQLKPSTRVSMQRLVDRHFQQAGEFAMVSCLEEDEVGEEEEGNDNNELFEDEFNTSNGVSALPVATATPIGFGDLELAETTTATVTATPVGFGDLELAEKTTSASSATAPAFPLDQKM